MSAPSSQPRPSRSISARLPLGLAVVFTLLFVASVLAGVLT